jgi:hypothetical protein
VDGRTAGECGVEALADVILGRGAREEPLADALLEDLKQGRAGRGLLAKLSRTCAGRRRCR